jgi:hypothetical protein
MPDVLIPLASLTAQRSLSVNPSEPFVPDPRDQFREACRAWLARSSSRDTRSNYDRDLAQFMAFAGIGFSLMRSSSIEIFSLT